ncbi:MAG: sensor histidine kinase [Chitinivibrionales bacterium]
MHAAICDFVSDIFQNACEAGATRIDLSIERVESRLSITVSDNGKGMDQDQLQRVRDPFYSDGKKHPERRVGLGIPFLIQATEQSGGNFEIQSGKQSGTVVRFSFDLNSIDCPPVGNMIQTIAGALSGCDAEVIVHRSHGHASYTISRSQLREALGSLDDIQALSLVKQYIQSQEENLISGDTGHG